MSLSILFRCLKVKYLSEEISLLMFQSLFSAVISLLASVECAKSMEERVLTAIILTLMGCSVLVSRYFLDAFAGIYHGRYFYLRSTIPFVVISVTMLSSHSWLGIFSQLTEVKAFLTSDVYRTYVNSTYYLYLLCLIVLISLIAWDGLKFSSKNNTDINAKQRTGHLIAVSVFLEIAVSIYLIMDVMEFLVLGNTLCMVYQYIISMRLGIYNTEATAGNFLLDTMRDGIVILDQNDYFLRCNAAAERIFPQLKDIEIHKTNLKEFVRDKVGQHISCDGRDYEVEYRPLHNRNLYIGTVLCARDVTEVTERMEILEQRRKQAADLAESIKTLVDSAVHEVRSPMNIIMGSARLAMQEPISPQARFYMMQIDRFGWDLLNRVDLFLDVARHSSGQFSSKVENFRLDEKLYKLYYAARLLVGDKDIEVCMEVDPKLPLGLIGTIDLYAIMSMNLLSNAVKYTESGRIDIIFTYEPVENRRINICTQVKDTGIGIRKEDMDRIFKDYERVSDSEAVGSGLGLPAVKRLVDQLGGTIEFESEYGKGSTFSITMPLEIYDETPIGIFNGEQAPSEISGAAKFAPEVIAYEWVGARVLIIDDMELNIEILDNAISRYGVSVDVARHEAEAVERFKKNHYDMVFMDYWMEDGTGIKLKEQLEEIKPSDNCAFIVVTADASSDRKEYYKKQFDGYMWKPIKPGRLEYMLNKFLPRSKRTEVRHIEEVTPGKNYLIPIFCKEVRSILEDIPVQLSEGRYGNIAVKIHGIKGACREVGFHEFAQYAQIIEDDLRDGTLKDMDEIVVEFVSRAKSLIEKYEKTGEDREARRESQRISELRNSKQRVAREISAKWVEETAGFIEEFDYDSAMELIEDIIDSVSEEDREVLIRVRNELDELEYDRAVEVLRTLSKPGKGSNE
ncbi:MAG: response regulator [Eubacterium sp.]|nr:response regulator [Eubacterium sp.]